MTLYWSGWRPRKSQAFKQLNESFQYHLFYSNETAEQILKRKFIENCYLLQGSNLAARFDVIYCRRCEMKCRCGNPMRQYIVALNDIWWICIICGRQKPAGKETVSMRSEAEQTGASQVVKQVVAKPA
jgi:hypothetical protein